MAPRPGCGTDADQPARAERDQLGDDGGGARPAEAGALDGQRRAVGGRPAVAPQPAVVVEHPRSRRSAAGRAGARGRGPRAGARAPATGSWGLRTWAGASQAPRIQARIAPPWRKRTRRTRRRPTRRRERQRRRGCRGRPHRGGATFSATARRAVAARSRAGVRGRSSRSPPTGSARCSRTRVLAEIKGLRSDLEGLTTPRLRARGRPRHGGQARAAASRRRKPAARKRRRAASPPPAKPAAREARRVEHGHGALVEQHAKRVEHGEARRVQHGQAGRRREAGGEARPARPARPKRPAAARGARPRSARHVLALEPPPQARPATRQAGAARPRASGRRSTAGSPPSGGGTSSGSWTMGVTLRLPRRSSRR